MIFFRKCTYKFLAKGFVCAFIFCCMLSCNQQRKPRIVKPAFYYWKSMLNVSSFEQGKLDSLRVKLLYIKFFDVDWDEITEQPIPVARLQITNFQKENYSIVPTIFITNECIQKIDLAQVAILADNINKLIRNIINTNRFNSIREIQLDCDWTASTQRNYFLLLEKIKMHWPNTAISCTIRLHQIKFISKTGVPPVKKGLLMCYNMGNLKNAATQNSILETAELEKYISNLSSYPLPLDIALPLFDWKVLFRNNAYAGLVENLPDSFINNIAIKKDNRLIILRDTTIAGYSLKKDDVLRVEESSYAEIISAAKSISRQLKNDSLTVSLYHLDSLILKKYKIDELEDIYGSLH